MLIVDRYSTNPPSAAWRPMRNTRIGEASASSEPATPGHSAMPGVTIEPLADEPAVATNVARLDLAVSRGPAGPAVPAIGNTLTWYVSYPPVAPLSSLGSEPL